MKTKLFKANGKKTEKVLLAIKTFLGSIAVTALVSGSPVASSLILMAGAFIDLLVDIFFEDDTLIDEPENTPKQ